jgi:hypothetical protein
MAVLLHRRGQLLAVGIEGYGRNRAGMWQLPDCNELFGGYLPNMDVVIVAPGSQRSPVRANSEGPHERWVGATVLRFGKSCTFPDA